MQATKKPKVTLYVITDPEIRLTQLKGHLREFFHVQKVSTLEADNIKSVIFKTNLWQVNDIWSYLAKKRGVKKIWLGK